MKFQQTYWFRQNGGTLMGMIVGLVVGLGIAVGVALLITKTSTPFTNKYAKSEKAEAPVTQMQDPNKPMYGNKEIVKDAAKDLNRPIENTRPAETKVDIVAVEKPIEKPEIKPADVSPKTDVVDDKYIYFLQAGAFREPADAESTRAKLALLGFEARINEKTSESGNLYRVRIGPFAQLETMNRIRSKLSENRVDVAVVRTAK